MSKQTPDEMPRFNRPNHLDKTEHGTVGHDMGKIIQGATDIKRSPNGHPCHLDQNVGKNMTQSIESGLSAGGGNLREATRSIKSGARAEKADTAFLRKG